MISLVFFKFEFLTKIIYICWFFSYSPFYSFNLWILAVFNSNHCSETILAKETNDQLITKFSNVFSMINSFSSIVTIVWPWILTVSLLLDSMTQSLSWLPPFLLCWLLLLCPVLKCFPSRFWSLCDEPNGRFTPLV